MRLERIFTHRVVRLGQAILPILVLALVAVPAWNYYARRAQRNDSPRGGSKLPSGVSVRTDGFKYVREESGRTQFIVRAKQSLAFQDDKYILQDVDVTIFGANGQDPPRTIHGANCTYNQATNDFTCSGNVEVQLDNLTVVRTEKVSYNHQDGIVIAPERAVIEKNGTTGRASTFEYGMNTGLLKLNGDVNVQTAEHVEIQTGSALFHQKENWTTMSGGVLIKSTSGWIRGETARATLTPETYKPKVITVDGSVTAESQSQTTPEKWKLRSRWLEATMSDAGVVERVQTRGDVEVEKSGGSAVQRIAGQEVDATLKEGKIDTIEARQNARMAMGLDQTLEASQIWTNASGSVKTTDSSVLKVGESTIQGREFVIENGDIVTFSTLRRATMKKEGGLESASDQTRARFESRTNMLLELVQTGNFEFRTPQYNGSAQTGRFEDGGSIVILDGSPVVNDAEKRLEASQIRVNQKDNSFVAIKNVSTLMKSPTDPVLVKASRAEGGGESMLYTGDVRLWRGEAYITAGLLRASGGRDRGNSKFHAEAGPGGKVQSNLQNIRTTADSLDYEDAAGAVRYLGHVRAQKQDMILNTPEMVVHFRDNAVTEIVASGGVEVIRADQRGTGERAVYDAATDVVTLTGKNAQLRDKERFVQGPTLVIRDKGNSASAEGGNGERTVTRHPVKNDKK